MRSFVLFGTILFAILFFSQCNENNPPPPSIYSPEIVWTYELSGNLRTFGNVALGPDETVFFTAGGGAQTGAAARLFAISPNTSLTWESLHFPHHTASEPVIARDSTIYVVCQGTLYAFDHNTGNYKWTWSPSDNPTDPHDLGWPTLGPEGVIFVAHSDTTGGYTTYIYAIRDGQKIWSMTHNNSYVATHLTVGFHKELFVKWNENGRDQIESYMLNSNEPIWKTRVDGIMGDNNGIALNRDENLVVTTDEPEEILKINRLDGEIMWRSVDNISGVPSIDQDRSIYIMRPNDGLYKLTENGSILWNIQNGLPRPQQITLDDSKNTVFIGRYEGKTGMHIVTKDGELWGFTEFMGNQYSAAIAFNGTIYMLGEGYPGKLYALDGPDRLSRFAWPRPRKDNRNSGSAYN